MMAIATGRAAHATAALIGETGLLFTGPSGSGKTETALSCVYAARLRGLHAALVADDGVWIEARGGRILAAAPAAIRGRAELRGSAIVAPPLRSPVVLHAVVAPGAAAGAGRLPREDETCRVGDVTLPLLRLRYGAAFDPLAALALLAATRGLAAFCTRPL